MSKWSELGAQMASIVAGAVDPAASSRPAAGVEVDRQEGVVAEWTPRGYGFIHFTDGRRAYVHNSQCGGEHLVVGETVSAVLSADAANPGKWAAQAVQRYATAEYAEYGQPDPLAAAAASVHQVVAGVPELVQAAAIEGRQEGVVTEWNARGFGFIQFSDGRRAYVHNSSCGGNHLAEGETVLAECVDDAQNPGKWAAVNVQQIVHVEAGEEGTVTEWREEGGFGFMTMADGKRAYIHRSSFGGKGSLFVGMKLRVTVTPDLRNPGKWSVDEVIEAMSVDPSVLAGAASPTAAAVAAAPQPDPETAEPPHTCTITDWDQRGFGFMKTDDGRRAYVHNSSCGGEHLQVGELVTAHIVPDPQNPGKWSALNVQRGVAMAGGGEEGTVTDWVEAGGYGFLSMDDGRRAYVHRNTFGGKGSLAVGTRLSVTTKPDPRNPGKWCVGEVKSELPPASAEQLLLGSVLDASAAQAAAMQAQQQQQEVVETCEGGTVQEWQESGGYGFLAMDDGKRAYIHRNTFGGKGSLMVGSRLSVTTKPDPRNPGKYCVGQVLAGLQGEHVPLSDKMPEQQPVEPQGVPEEGIVSEWKEEGGYGFLSMTDGRRAYIHRNSFGGTGSLVVGMGLQVTTKADPRNPGKWCVGEVLNVLAATTDEPAPKRHRTGFDQLPPA